MENVEATVPIIEALGPDYKVLNDSVPIATFLNERFTEKEGFKFLRDVDKVENYEEKVATLGRGLIRWIMNDVYENALDPNDGSKEYFKTTREAFTKCPLKDVTEVRGGGEAAVLKLIEESWQPLKERMKGEEGSGEREYMSSLMRAFRNLYFVATYIDFYDAAHLKWVEASSVEKYKRLLGMYGDDTFTKLLKKVEKYTL